MTVFIGGRYFVYAIVDPRDEQIFYIGQSEEPQRRAEQHIYDDTGSPEKRERIRAIHRDGKKAYLRIISAHRTRRSAMIHEKALIHFLDEHPDRQDELWSDRVTANLTNIALRRRVP